MLRTKFTLIIYTALRITYVQVAAATQNIPPIHMRYSAVHWQLCVCPSVYYCRDGTEGHCYTSHGIITRTLIMRACLRDLANASHIL